MGRIVDPSSELHQKSKLAGHTNLPQYNITSLLTLRHLAITWEYYFTNILTTLSDFTSRTYVPAGENVVSTHYLLCIYISKYGLRYSILARYTFPLARCVVTRFAQIKNLRYNTTTWVDKNIKYNIITQKSDTIPWLKMTAENKWKYTLSYVSGTAFTPEARIFLNTKQQI